MTNARIAPGRCELRTRHGVLVSIGFRYDIVCLSSRTREEGWCDIPDGAGEPGTTVE